MVNIGEEIQVEVRRQNRTITWLAQEICCDRTNLYKIFKKQSIDTGLLMRISEVLGRNFFLLYV